MIKKIYFNKFPLLILYKYLNKIHKNRLKIFLFSSISLSFFEIFILSTLYPLLLNILNKGETNNSYTSNIIISKFTTTNLLSIFLLSIVISSVIKVWLVLFNGETAAIIGSDVNKKIFKNSLFTNYDDFLTINSSETIVNLTTISESCFKSLFISFQFINSIINIIGVFVGLLIINVSIAISSITIFGLAYFIIGKYARKKLQMNGKIIVQENKKKIKFTQEGLGSIRDVILDNSQNYYLENFTKVDYLIRKLSANNLFYTIIPKYIIESLVMFFIGIIIFILTLGGNEQGNSTLAIFAVFALGAQRLLPSIQQAYGSWAQIKSYQNAIELINIQLHELEKKSLVIYEKVKLDIKEIELKNIFYNYPNTNNNSLVDISLCIKQGDHIGIIGKTGSGKSTLLDTLMGLLKPSSGKLIINEIDIYNHKNSKKLINSWRNSIAHVPQNIFITDDTIARNIAFGDFKDIDYEKVKYCAKLANISNFIESLPNGYFTILGERGSRLSGGQKQRIGIARALYKESSIIILDEATSALDTLTEGRILHSFSLFKDKKTIITVTHRYDSVKTCDKVIKLSDGKIEQIGGPKDII